MGTILAAPEASYESVCCSEEVLQELRRAERHVEECDLENFDRMEESLRQLEDALNSAE